MSYRNTLGDRSPPKSFFGLQPAPAWTAILGLIFFSTLCILANLGRILNLAFPLGALAVGVLLYFRYPILYIGFTWWMWFLTPFVRRLADYRGGGFTDPSPILLAPYLVTLVTVITIWRNLPKSGREGGLPFILSLAGVFYGFAIGLINRTPVEVGIGLLDWLSPVSFSFHLFMNWRDYPSYRQNIQRTFAWGVLVMGVYGIIQYALVPAWDRAWVINSGMTTSQGQPVPFKMRIWSTMNSGEPFAAIMGAGLLLLFAGRGTLRISASIAGYLAFLISTVRAAWIGWFAGLLTLGTSLKPNLQIRIIVSFLVIVICIVPLATIEPFSQTIEDRLQTFSNLEEDGSVEARKDFFQEQIDSALTSFVGEGIGGPTRDNAILSLLFNMGWIGTIFYMGGMSLLVFGLFQSSEGSFDLFTGISRAIVVSGLVRIPVNNPIGEVSGIALWGFLGIGMAAHKYYWHQRTRNLQ